ncbi:MAG: carbamoyl phosphate synthase small subunit [Clostridia bacterium]|nr:carbamoyl phosphate synthase small subunit [Clostridia bacterium]
MKAYLILEDGSVYSGESIGAVRDCICEVVFNTSAVGYVETLSDPSYYSQGVVLTYPIVGSYGVNLSDMESNRIWAKCLIVRELSQAASNFRMEITLSDYLCRYGVPGIEGVDTRALTKKLRDNGTMAGFLTTTHFEVDEVVAKLKEYKSKNAVKAVTSVSKAHFSGEGKKVAVIDYGVRKSLVDEFVNRGMDVTVFPATTPADEILSEKFDGIILSNGPGNPCDNEDLIDEVKKIYSSGTPILAIELGHELLALSAGGKVEKMGHGHRGGNYPVKFVDKNRSYITSQNHGYVVTAIDENIAEVSHVNINDGTIEGIKYKGKDIVSVQFAPGSETSFVFDEFVMMMGGKENA